MQILDSEGWGEISKIYMFPVKRDIVPSLSGEMLSRGTCHRLQEGVY